MLTIERHYRSLMLISACHTGERDRCGCNHRGGVSDERQHSRMYHHDRGLPRAATHQHRVAWLARSLQRTITGKGGPNVVAMKSFAPWLRQHVFASCNSELGYTPLWTDSPTTSLFPNMPWQVLRARSHMLTAKQTPSLMQ
jgi:hypothetical protein